MTGDVVLHVIALMYEMGGKRRCRAAEPRARSASASGGVGRGASRSRGATESFALVF